MGREAAIRIDTHLLGKGPKDVASDVISAGVTDYRQKESSTDQDELVATRITNAVSAHCAEHLTAGLIQHTSYRSVGCVRW